MMTAHFVTRRQMKPSQIEAPKTAGQGDEILEEVEEVVDEQGRAHAADEGQGDDDLADGQVMPSRSCCGRIGW